MSVKVENNRAESADNEFKFSDLSTVENLAIKKVLRENWESRLKEKGSMVDILNQHSAFMTGELGSFEYSRVCMPIIAVYSKHMSKGEVYSYLKHIEALVIGYKFKFRQEYRVPLIAGVIVLSKNAVALKKHFDYFLQHISQGSSRYKQKIENEIKENEYLASDLSSKNSSILRFFKKKEIIAISNKMKAKQAKISRLEKKKGKYESLTSTLKSKTSQQKKN